MNNETIEMLKKWEKLSKKDKSKILQFKKSGKKEEIGERYYLQMIDNTIYFNKFSKTFLRKQFIFDYDILKLKLRKEKLKKFKKNC